MSMKNAGILDGDLVAVHRTPEVRSRQIVVARLENEVTVKRYRQEGSVVWLMPENAEFEPIKVDLQAAAAAHRRHRGGRGAPGKATGCIRCLADDAMSCPRRSRGCWSIPPSGGAARAARAEAIGTGFAALDACLAGKGLAAHGPDRNPHPAARAAASLSAPAAARGAHQPARRALVRLDCASPRAFRAGARRAWRGAREDSVVRTDGGVVGFRAGARSGACEVALAWVAKGRTRGRSAPSAARCRAGPRAGRAVSCAAAPRVKPLRRAASAASSLPRRAIGSRC